jgi:hypothetical protein
MRVKTYLGTLANIGAIDMKLVPNQFDQFIRGYVGVIALDQPKVYIVGAQADTVLSDTNTTKNFPNPFDGERTAETRPPTFEPSSNPVCHTGTLVAAEANAAPSICVVIYETIIINLHCNR